MRQVANLRRQSRFEASAKVIVRPLQQEIRMQHPGRHAVAQDVDAPETRMPFRVGLEPRLDQLSRVQGCELVAGGAQLANPEEAVQVFQPGGTVPFRFPDGLAPGDERFALERVVPGEQGVAQLGVPGYRIRHVTDDRLGAAPAQPQSPERRSVQCAAPRRFGATRVAGGSAPDHDARPPDLSLSRFPRYASAPP